MKIKTFLALFLLLNISLVAREVNGDGDFQFWLHQSYTHDLNKKGNFHLYGEERWGGDASVLFFFYLQANFAIPVTDWLEVAPGYRQAFRRDFAANQWRPIYEPMGYAIMKHTFKKWEFSIRHQVQYRIFDDSPPSWAYRIRPGLVFPIKLGKIGVQPYISDEFFFTESVGYHEYRFIIGFRVPLISKLSSNIEYIDRSIKRDRHWDKQSIMRLMLNLHF